MARIRSVHPSLFTDEAFMSCSMAARQLMIGLWCEAYCDGVFEWKPLTLKARLFPVDSVDVGELLAELETHDVVKRFEVKGKAFGAIRNFRKFQRPKSPKPSDVLPEDMAAYVGILDSEKPSTPPSGEKSPVMANDGQTSPKSPQMEDGGCKMEEKGKEEKPRGKRATKTSIPDNWYLTDADKNYALEKGIAERRLGLMAEKFFTHHKAKGSTFKDWHLAWCTWVQNDVEWAGKRATGPPQGVSSVQAYREKLAQRKASNGNS